ncbi:MAG TPA: hypothetical protein DEP28_07310 [Bacteroidetes bacterium]|nr:PAS domain S-box protein [Ignavibacteria bacterium]HCA43045.1 hypothetical protein [Bacteroidota bacterium]
MRTIYLTDKNKKLETRFNELARSKSLPKKILDSTDSLIYIYDFVNQKNAFVNNKIFDLTGYTPEEIREFGYKFFTELIHQDDFPNIAESIEKLYNARDGESVRSIYRIRKKDGEYIWLKSRDVVFERDEYGDPTYILGIAVEITKLKEAVDKLDILEQAVRNIDESIIITDAENNGKFPKVLYVNAGFENLIGIKHEEVINEHLDDLSIRYGFKDKSKCLFNIISENILKNNTNKIEAILKRKCGNEFFSEISISPVIRNDSNGKVVNYIMIQRDISLRKQAEADMMKAKRQAEELNKLKSNFISMMSHEIRTPLTGIMGFAELLNNDLKNTDYKDMTENILNSSNRLMETLNLMFYMNNLDSGNIEVSFESVNVSSYIHKIFEELYFVHRNSHLNFDLKVTEENLFSNIDKKIFEVIITNLVSNAFKFTNEGSVNIKVTSEEKFDKKYCVVKVIDTGIGMDEVQQKLIFDEFRQLSEGYNRFFEGTGLGLTIAKRLVELLHGEIKVESKLGVGSIFSISIPVIENNSHLFATTEMLHWDF